MLHFIRYRFVITNFHPCILTYKTETFFMAIYGDDITLYGPSNLMMNNIKNTLKFEFKVMDLGDLHWLLGIQIKFGLKCIELSQTAYIDSVISRFDLQDYNSTILSIDRGTALTRSNPENVLKVIKTFQSMIGSIMYRVTGTRPILTFAISLFSPNFSLLQTSNIWQW
jgi:hypothetical protein